jgi:uroporphyrin-3 C-methyltransferase
VKKEAKNIETKKVETNDEVDCTTVESASLQDSSKKRPASIFSSRFGIVTIILAMMGIVISVDSLVKVKEWHKGLTTFKEQLQKRLESEQNRLDGLEASLQDIGIQQKNFDQKLNTYNSTLSAFRPLLDKRTQQQAAVDISWQLEKVYEWLQEAKLDLNWSDDPKAALLLLESADDVIEQLDIPDLAYMHTLIEQNIKTLSAIQPINQIDLLEKIKVLSNAVMLLPSPQGTTPKSDAASQQVAESSDNSWHSVVNRVENWFKKIVVVKPANPAFSNKTFQSRHILNENLIIALQQAQWALLQKDDVLFHWSLEQIVQMVSGSNLLIDESAQETKVFLDNLSFLENQNLQLPELPDLQPACQQLKTYMNTLKVQPVAEVTK